MKKGWLFLTLGVALACGCAKDSGGSGSSASGPTGEGARTLTIAAFEGGYGVDFFEKVAKEYEADHPGLKVTLEGDPRIWEKLRPRFIGGTPPDLCFPGWGMDHWALMDEGQLLPLDEALDQKPYEGEGTWRDTFEPAMLKLGQKDGRTWMLPYFYSVMGWWYDPGVFEKNGWKPPKTYDELLALCETIKAKGIAPMTFQGKYPFYILDGMLMPWICSVGGPEAVKDCQNLEPGAWSSPAVLQAAKMIDEMNKKGYFQRGAIGMTHTEAQQQFLQGKAAMVMCGTWMRSEMANAMPPGSAMRFFLPPVVAGGKGDPTAVMIKIEPWMVPSRAKNQKDAIELYRRMTSLSNAKKFVEEKGTLMAIKGSDQAKLIPELEEPARVMRASKYVFAARYREWYPTLGKELEDSTTAMLNGSITPEQFCERVEKKAREVARDGSILKHKFE